MFLTSPLIEQAITLIDLLEGVAWGCSWCKGDFSPTTSVCRALGACDFNVRSTSTGYCSDLGSDLFFGVFLFNRAISSPAEGGAFTLPPRIMSLALSFCR